jgi:ATP-dependent RNA helicase RhlE
VLDEADQMFDMGFLPTIRRVLRVLPQKRQNLLFSATMPRELRGLAMEVLRSPQTVEVSRGEAAVTITHSIYEVQQEQKVSLLQHLLSTIPSDSVLVFTRTKHRAKRLAQQLKALGRSVTSLQGNLTQGQRVRAMEGFRSGDYQIMVATDIAARGIDVSSVSHVINFDIPDTVDAYVHRIGRTGRAAKDGDAFTFVTREDLGMLRDIERRMGGKLQRGKIPENLPFVAPPQREGGERRERPQRGGGQGQRQGRSRNQGQGQSEGYGQGSGQSRSQRSEYNRNWRGGSNQQQSPGGQSRRRNSGRNFDNRATRV